MGDIACLPDTRGEIGAHRQPLAVRGKVDGIDRACFGQVDAAQFLARKSARSQRRTRNASPVARILPSAETQRRRHARFTGPQSLRAETGDSARRRAVGRRSGPDAARPTPRRAKQGQEHQECKRANERSIGGPSLENEVIAAASLPEESGTGNTRTVVLPWAIIKPVAALRHRFPRADPPEGPGFEPR